MMRVYQCILVWMAVVLIVAPTLAGDSPETMLPLAEERDAYEPAAAFGREVLLVAWKSGHLAPGDLRKGLNFIGDIVACRLDRTGKVLDAKPFVICSATDLQERPRIAVGQDNFLAVWQDLRNGKDWDVYAARVTPEGKVLDPEGILVAGGAHNQALPDVTWDGKNFQVVWQDFRSGKQYEICGARISPDGKPLDAKPRLLAAAKPPGSFVNPVVAANSGKSLLFWLGGGGPSGGKCLVAGTHLIVEGEVNGKPTFENFDPRTSPGSGTAHLPLPASVTAGPSAYLVCWTTHAPRGRGNAPNDAQAGLFSTDGKMQRKLLLRSGKEDRLRNPQAAWDGSAFIVAWDHNDEKRKPDQDPTEVVAWARVFEDGTVEPQKGVFGSAAAPAVKPAVASDGKGTAFVVYERHPEKADAPIRIAFRMIQKK